MEKNPIDILTGKELFEHIIANKAILTAEKKMTIKLADPFRLSKSGLYVDREGTIKAAPVTKESDDFIERSCVINTCWVMDSHKDVHIPGIWKKSLQETKDFYLLQEHSMTFKGIITDDVKALAKTITWKELGVDMTGETQALIFNVGIPKGRNPFMFQQYKDNNVKNHSVGMQYVVIELAINDEDYKEEFAVWNKYINQIMNKNDAEDQGYFWAVKEAKVVEGSAVPIGSNRITPTLGNKSNQMVTDEAEPEQSTRRDQPNKFDLDQAIKEIKLFN